MRDHGEGQIFKLEDLERGLTYYYVENGEVKSFRDVNLEGEVGAATMEGYEGKGIARALHDAHWDDIGVADDPVRMAEEIAKQPSYSVGGKALNRAAARDRLNGLNVVRLDQMRASRQSDIAEKLKVESLMRGRTDDTMPMDFEDMRHLEVTGNKWLTTVQKSLDALGEFPRGTNVPALYAPDAKRLLRGLTRIFAVPGTEGSGAVKGYQQGAFWLPGIPVPPEALANASRRSYEALIAYGKTMGVSDDVIARYMSQWADLRSGATARPP